jgi:hypothetical protein
VNRSPTLVAVAVWNDVGFPSWRMAEYMRGYLGGSLAELFSNTQRGPSTARQYCIIVSVNTSSTEAFPVCSMSW